MIQQNLKNLWQQNKGFLVFLGLLFVFRSAVADINHVPTGSMEPTIRIGDRILIDRMAYDLRVPFTHVSLKKLGDPARGDIIIFDSKVSDKRLVKRVIGLPGDRVALKSNRLIINGEAAEYQDGWVADFNHEQLEVLSGSAHHVNTTGPSQLDNFPTVIVPEEHYLVLGDNRNNSADSRVIGFVPREEIVGKTERVLLSLDKENYYLPRAERWITPLDPTLY